MRKLTFWQEDVEGLDDEGNDNGIFETKWFCSDGISTFFGDTKAEAASHFGVPVGDFDIKSAAAALGRKGGLARSERKTESCRANARKPRKKTIE